MSNITINSKGEISYINIVDSQRTYTYCRFPTLQISEHLRNIRKGHYSKYMANKRKIQNSKIY